MSIETKASVGFITKYPPDFNFISDSNIWFSFCSIFSSINKGILPLYFFTFFTFVGIIVFMKVWAFLYPSLPSIIIFFVLSSYISLIVLLIISLSWWIKEGAIEFIALSLIWLQVFISVTRSLLISFLVLLLPAVLTINPISFGIIISFKIDLIFFRSAGLKIFLDIPPPFGVLGINTIYLPAIEINVLSAAPFWPLSSLITCTRITWFGFITSCILYLLNLFFCFFSFSSSKFSLFSNSSLDSFLISKGSSISSFPSAIFSFSLASTSFDSCSLAFSSSSFIFSKSALGIW